MPERRLMWQRGDRVVVIDYKGRKLARRVWEDAGRSVIICSEDEYQRTILTGDEPLFVGWPRGFVQEPPPAA